MGKKKEQQLEEVVIENTPDVSKEEVSKDINDDLYAPFGDKTFNKDELLSANTSNNVDNSPEETKEEVDNSTISEPETTEENIDLDKVKNDNGYIGHLDYDLIKQHIKQKKTKEEQNDFDYQMIKAYMGKGYETFTTKKFNLYAFLLGAFYLMYRKMYLYGILIYVVGITLISYFISNLVIVGIVIGALVIINLLFGLKFNEMYLNNSYRQIKKIEKIYNANRDEYVLSKCKSIGGTSIVSPIIISILFGTLIIVGIIELNNFI